MTAPHFTRGGAAPRPGTDGPADMFESALRGYDRRQVDDKIRDLQTRLTAAGVERSEAGDQLVRERGRAERAESELAQARSRIEQLSAEAGSDHGAGFGQRAERLIRMAENEAAEARAAAANEAATILEQARGEAEAHRHQVEQELINKAAQQDQEASRRTAQLKEREQEIANERTAARQETEEMRESAKREAARMVQEAEVKAADVRRQAERFADQQRDTAVREVDRLTGMRRGVRSELARLHQYLGAELTEDDEPAADPADEGQDTAPARRG